MVEPLREHQYEVLAEGAEEGFLFGTEDTGYMTGPRPIHGSGEIRNVDRALPGEDGTGFGRDRHGGKSVSFDIDVLTDVRNYGLLDDRPTSALQAHRTNLDYLERIEGVWTDERWRTDPNAYAILRACEGGRTSRAYGRPRRYDEVAGAATRQGWTKVTCDFTMRDGLWYSDLEYSAMATLRPISEGGIVAPLVAPIATTASAEGGAVAVIGGARRTWLTVEFTGPVIDPSVTVGGLTIGLTGSIAHDETIVIDPRPWRRTVLRNTDGVSLAGRLSGATPPMTEIRIEPGSHPITFRGRDDTGTARALLRWRDARKRP